MLEKCCIDLSLRKQQVFRETRAPIPLLEHAPVRFMAHDHHARRAGRHFDMRIALTGMKAYSWATRHGFPEKPGESRVWYRQPDHTIPYMDFTGKIPEGEFGHGDVRKAFDTQAIASSGPGRIDFTMPSGSHAGRYTMLHEDGQAWRVIKKKPLEYFHSERRPFSEHVPEHMWTDPNVVASDKKDGAHVIAQVNPGGLGIVSQRISVKGGLIPKEDHVPWLRDLKIPKEFHGMVLRGELYHPEQPFNVLSGILNSNPAKAVQAQQAMGKIKLAPFDIEKLPGGVSAHGMPYEQKLELLERFAAAVKSPHIELPTYTTGNKRSFYEDIVRRGGEGVILTPLSAVDLPGQPHTAHKMKRVQDWDLKIVGFTPHSKRPDQEIGAVLVADRAGKTIAQVGTGLSLEQRRDMAANPQSYLGKLVKVRGMEATHESIRAPRFAGFTTDKDKPDFFKGASVSTLLELVELCSTHIKAGDG